MGTPEFAVASLDQLVQAGYDIVGVITSTDKYGGRNKKKLIESDVKKYAVSKGLNILQPKNLKAPAFIEELKALKADVQVVVAFRMLPVVVWDMPRLGTINLHGSLLPKYRGAAPIHWAVINGEKETGVTSFRLKHAIDEGDIIYQEKMAIEENDTTGDVHDKMMHLGAEVILKTVQDLEKGNVQFLEQDDTQATKAPKIFTATAKINFNQPTQKVFDFIRGMSPFPTAWTTIDGTTLKIFKAEKETIEHDFPIGSIHSDNKRYLKIATQDGFINILDLQLRGKKRLQIKDFLNGYSVKSLPKIHTLDLEFIGLKKTIACYLVETSYGPILFETGPYSTFPKLKSEIEKAGFQIEDIKHVFLTHIHLDHAGSAWAMAQLGAQIYVHPRGAKHLGNPERLMASAKRIYKDQMDSLWGRMESIKEEKITILEHNQVIEIGDRKIIAHHTPGHAVHHIAYQIQEIIFTGDVAGVKIGNGPVQPPCPPPDIHIEDWLDSIDLMLNLDVHTLYLTHFDDISDKYKHLNDLKMVLSSWADFIKTAFDKQQSVEETIPEFESFTYDQLKQAGLNKVEISQYQRANPNWMSVSGLMRYWKKKDEFFK